jgi:hypothetical protein
MFAKNQVKAVKSCSTDRDEPFWPSHPLRQKALHNHPKVQAPVVLSIT